MKKINILIFTIFIIVSCQPKSKTYTMLETTDSLLCNDNIDSAAALLHHIKEATSLDEENMSYFNLLQTIIDYRNYADITSDSLILSSVNYYRKTNNKHKLAISQYYRGAILSELNKQDMAVLALKEAEDLGEQINDPMLLTNIYRQLTILNYGAGHIELAKKYAHKHCTVAEKNAKNKWTAYAYLYLAIIYSNNNQSDSAKIYLDKCLLIADNINPEDKAYVHNYIGKQLLCSDTATAKLFFSKALSFQKFPESYFYLAQIHRENGDIPTAQTYMDSALATTAWSGLKIKILESIANAELQANNIRQYANAMQQIISIKDSINVADNDKKTLEFQQKYDFNKLESTKREQLIVLTSIILLLLMFSYLLHLRHKSKLGKIENEKNKETTEKAILAQQNAELEMELLSLQKKNADMTYIISLNQNKIKQLESEGTTYNTELQKLKSQMNMAQAIQQEIIKKGLSVMKKIEKNETYNWTQQDFSYAIIYYESQNPNVIYEIELEYDNLTTFEKFFLILDKYMEKNDDEIAQILSISAVTVRTRRSKIKAKKTQLTAS